MFVSWLYHECCGYLYSYQWYLYFSKQITLGNNKLYIDLLFYPVSLGAQINIGIFAAVYFQMIWFP